MEDVAALAGVSLSTVSRVFSRPDLVSEATLRRVEAAARKLDYVPNLTAGSLAGAQSRIIGAVVPTIANAIFSQTTDSLAGELDAKGYQLILSQSRYDDSRELAVLQTLVGRRVDGIVITGVVRSPEARRLLAKSGLPVVETWELTTRPVDMLVGFSNKAAGAAAARFLIERGYRSFGFIGGTDRRSEARWSGFSSAVVESGLREPNRFRVFAPAPSSINAGAEGLAALRAAAAETHAVFCTNDLLAAGALYQCQRSGIAVPGEMAVMGFSDLEFARSTVPPLTTVHVNAAEIGAEAAALILDAVAGRRSRRVVNVAFSVIEREST